MVLCANFHRHQLHLASYGCVSLTLILAGFVFTVFAIFQKDSQIGKIWLAGPVLIVVGAVLCGKVMIDWGPAMQRGRSYSVDSHLVDEFVFSNLLPSGTNNKASSSVSALRASCDLLPSASSAQQFPSAQFPIVPFRSSISASNPGAPRFSIGPCCTSSGSTSSPRAHPPMDQFGPFDRIIYGPSDHPTPSNGEEDEEEDYEEEMEEKGMKKTNRGKRNERMMMMMMDKTTQAEEGGGGCEKCNTLWTILNANGERMMMRSRGEEEEERRRSPKVIGKFVMAELMNRGGGGGGRKVPERTEITTNYGAMMARNSAGGEGRGGDPQRNSAERRARPRGHSQGETLIMNERSFLI